MNIRFLSVLIFAFLISASLQAQSVITGKVVDNDTKEAVPGVTIVVKGSEQGSFTDSNGKFSVKIQSLPATLVFSFIGFETYETEVSSAQDLFVELKSGPVFLN